MSRCSRAPPRRGALAQPPRQATRAFQRRATNLSTASPRRARSTYFYRLPRRSTPHTTRAHLHVGASLLGCDAIANFVRFSTVSLEARASAGVAQARRLLLAMSAALSASPFRLLDSPELLRLVADALDEDDALAFACATTAFRQVTCHRDHPCLARFPGGIRTRIAASVASPARMAWMRSMGLPWNKRVCRAAAQSGNLAVLQWARAQGCPWDECTCEAAAESGHLAVLQWARAQGCPWDQWTCHRAAEGGHLAVLQWARAQGCPWDENTCAAAAEGGHLAVLQWARAQGCPWDEVDVLLCGWRRPPRGAAVGARSGLPVGRWRRALMRLEAATSRCCSGRALRAARGTRRRALMRLKAATSPCCSGRTLRAARGTRRRALMRLKAATSRCCSGRAIRAAHGTRGRALMRLKAATSRCCSGRALRAANGMGR